MDYNEIRRKTKKISVGNVAVGGNAPVSVQSMTNTDSSDFDATYAQMKALCGVGCDIVRMTVPDENAVRTLARLKESDIDIPIVADIHFDYKLAIASADAGADKIRINPGNIGGEDRAAAVAKAAKAKGIPIRIGVNGGSLEKGILEKCGGDLAKAMVESAKRHIEILNRYDFDDIVLSMKSSDVRTTIAAYRLASQSFDYPLHLGVTEAGTLKTGIIKSAIGIGSLLADGIGDTIRVSLTDDPVKEVEAAKLILRALGMDDESIRVVSCPTCGRTKIDLISIANKVTEETEKLKGKLKVAVMGCVVNGPGEAKDADIGIAGGDGCAVLFKKGEIIKKLPEDEIVDALMDEIRRMI